MKRIVPFVLLLASCNPTTPAPEGPKDPFYAASFSALYQVGTSNAVDQKIGNFDLTSTLLDLALNPKNGELYGVSPSGFFSIDKTSGKATGITMTGLVELNALAFDADGKLWGMGGNKLYLLDVAAKTYEKKLTLSTAKVASGDLAFHNGTLFVTLDNGGAADTLATINQESGQTTELGTTGFDEVFGLTSLNGKLYGVTSDNELLTLNTTTGVGSKVRNLSFSSVGGQSL
ncbi:hypothetical protein [Deinococcus cellulosilyticus]|uniref:DUF4394 domain-containing protein n=1 Tax=Deinococcus cellulosilyticus (strain DSM 18568 / NBRC 106333 / KACC 11606 / 5516J-15) TaxID=1223518 RepID=A0A511N9C3_DEIC1|nr:hypothetical protein [Deinococcus cellulosilyticus]GEM49439.1 hypothetical protein DC3_50740 [Deinococcus cellulosilyticus NBRC 106333 = KACC 11606]